MAANLDHETRQGLRHLVSEAYKETAVSRGRIEDSLARDVELLHGRQSDDDYERRESMSELDCLVPGCKFRANSLRGLKSHTTWKHSERAEHPAPALAVAPQHDLELEVLSEHDEIEMVEHPGHYGGDTTYEVIKVIDAWGLSFGLGNAVKYIARAGKKPGANELEDLRKAAFYLNWRIQQLDDDQPY